MKYVNFFRRIVFVPSLFTFFHEKLMIKKDKINYIKKYIGHTQLNIRTF